MSYINRKHRFDAKFAAGAMAAVLAMALGACAPQEPVSDTTSAETPAASVQKKDDTKTESVKKDETKKEKDTEKQKTESQKTNPTAIGETSSEASKTKVTNGLEKDIASFKIRKSGDEKWSELLKENETIKSKGTVELGVASGGKDEKYDVFVKLADATTVEVDSLALETMSELTLKVEDGVGYATYKDTDGKEGTTKKQDSSASDKADKKQDGGATQSGSDSQDYSYDASDEYYDYSGNTSGYSYEEPSYETPSYEAPSYGEPSYEAPSYEAPSYQDSYSEPDYSYSEPVAQEAAPQETAPQEAAPQQNSDGCLDDVVLRY